MIVEYIDWHKRKELIRSDVTNYLLPYSGRISIMDIQSPILYVNGDAYDVENASKSIEVKETSMVIEVDSISYNIRVLCREYPDETLFDYNVLGTAYHNNLMNNRIDLETVENAIDEDIEDLKISLCTFNRRFESITKNRDIEGIEECVEKLTHIFQKPKQHLKQINELRPAAVVSRIGQESISHLASHSEHWKGIKASGLIPERLLARTLEDDFAIYENVAVKTMVDKLYKEMKALNTDSIDCLMQMQMDDGHSLSSEQKNYFHARDVLLKGMDDESVALKQNLLEVQRIAIQHILEKLSRCRSSPLYRKLKRQMPITGKLKKTNIFMMDKYYKHAYRLWELMSNEQKVSAYDGIQIITDEYTIFCKVLFFFALKYFHFEPVNETTDIMENDKLLGTQYCFKYWNLSMHEEHIKELGIDAFSVTITIDVPIELDVSPFDISESVIASFNGVELIDNQLVFAQALDDAEQENLVKKMKEIWPKSKKNRLASEFKQALYALFVNYEVKKKRILFVPWKYLLPDNIEEVHQVMMKIQNGLSKDGFDMTYILTSSRPNEFKNIDDTKVLNNMLSYGMANAKVGIEHDNLGVIPISLADINSYRRYTKILLNQMIELDAARKVCPICGEALSRGRGNADNISTCRSCGFQIIETQCSSCGKAYAFTRYDLPIITEIESDIPGFKVISRENKLAYKNTTEANVEEGRINPICPHCGK